MFLFQAPIEAGSMHRTEPASFHHLLQEKSTPAAHTLNSFPVWRVSLPK